jgi:flavodoxin
MEVVNYLLSGDKFRIIIYISFAYTIRIGNSAKNKTIMKRALILYKSRTGTTKKLGENIGKYLGELDVVADIKPIEEADTINLDGIDFLFLGCWTSGLMVIFQGPEKSWVESARKLPVTNGVTTVLFTTYKLLTGSMFRNMQKHLKFGAYTTPLPVIKSRNALLTEEGRTLLKQLVS